MAKDPRNRRILGKEMFKFVDDTEKEITIYAVSDFHMSRMRRECRDIELDHKNKTVKKVIFKDEEYRAKVLDYAVGSALDLQDITECDNAMDIYDKYFDLEENEDVIAKKHNTTDTSEQLPDKTSN